jgi:hypothetical protein
MYSEKDLADITAELIPLKKTADRELASIYGLTGMVYTPHLDIYMTACVRKSDIRNDLKSRGLIELLPVEVITQALDHLHGRAKNQALVEYEGNLYQRRFSPLKLSKSGKIVRKWAKYWLLQLADGNKDPEWERQVRDIWPTYFLIRTIND